MSQPLGGLCGAQPWSDWSAHPKGHRQPAAPLRADRHSGPVGGSKLPKRGFWAGAVAYTSTRPLEKSHAAMSTLPGKQLECFPNPEPGRDYSIRIRIPEFTCLCPKTGQPDFAELRIAYVPDRSCLELKSLKLYIWSFRDQGAFHEAVTNEILGALVQAVAPRFMRVTAVFNVRGGIYTRVVAEHRAPGWQALPPVALP